MKKSHLFVLLSFLADSVLGQVFIHADTTTFTDTALIKMQKEIELQKSLLLDFLESPQAHKILVREYSKVAVIPKKPTNSVKKYYRSCAPPSDYWIAQELARREERIRNAHYNIIVADYDFFHDRVMVGEVEDSSGYMGIYGVEDTTFETQVSALTGEVLRFPHFTFDPSPGDIALKSFFYDTVDGEYLETPTHELSHLSLDYNRLYL